MKTNICKYKNLEILRKIYSMTVDELMSKIGKPNGRSQYYVWQNGGNIKISDIIALRNVFDVSTDCILDVKPIQIEESTETKSA